MHNYLLAILLNHSIVLVAIVSFIRFKTVFRCYTPFVVLVWLGLLNESVSLALIYTNGSNAVNSNCYVLIDAILVFWQFYQWQTIKKHTLYLLALASLFFWTLDNFIWHSISGNNAVFRIIYSLGIVMCSIKQLNKLAMGQKFSLINNSTFIICIGFLMYYTLKAFIESFDAVHKNFSQAFYHNIFTILYTANCIANLIYVIAFLCTKKEKYIMQ